MKYQLFTYRGLGADSRPGIAVGGVHYDLRPLVQERWTSVDAVLEQWDAALPVLAALARQIGDSPARHAQHALGQPRMLAPLTRCGVIYATGANYRDHVLAMGKALNLPVELDPKAHGVPPWFFIKAGQGSLSGHHEDVHMPDYTSKLDWEAELAVIIGREAYQIAPEQALEHVAGYSCANDLSARDHLRRAAVDAASPFHYDWLGHKCFAGGCPLGPYLTPSEFVGNPENLGIRLWLNDELKQDSNTSNHLYGVADQISYLSHRMRLRPGDILLTGTPAGVGMESGVFLKRGDVMRVGIDGLGELTTRIV